VRLTGMKMAVGRVFAVIPTYRDKRVRFSASIIPEKA